MSLDEYELEIAEALYRAWSAEKRKRCAERRLSRVAEALCFQPAAVSKPCQAGLPARARL